MKPLQIVIIEDNPGDARLIQEMIRENPIHNDPTEFHFNNAERLGIGIDLLSSQGADLVLLDLNLPDSRGLESFLRIHAQFKEIPVIVLTGLQDEKMGLDAVKAGAQDYLIKDQIDGRLLVRTILFSIERQELLKSLDEKSHHLDLQKHALEQSNQRFYTILANTVDGIFIVDQNKIIRFMNPAAILIFGRQSGDCIGQEIWFPVEKNRRTDLGFTRSDNKPIQVELLVEDILWEGQNASLISARDVTERKHSQDLLEQRVVERTKELKVVNRSLIEEIVKHKKTMDQLRESTKDLQNAHEKLKDNQAQLLQTEKMASIGQLAAGVAHEINNPMAFVMSNLGTLKEYIKTFKQISKLSTELCNKLEGKANEESLELASQLETIGKNQDLGYISEDVDDLLNETQEGTERVKEIVLNLKSFARIDEAEVKDADINEGILSALKMVHNELKYHCEIKTELGDIPIIQCYPGQLNQVFLNMLINASQAIKDRGTVTLSTTKTPTHILISIKDTGCGIPEELLSKLYDPFFTTKEVGQGTGLGLSISHGIILKHGGKIEVESKVGEGTCFTIFLPIQGIQTENFEAEA
jgi:signal transduction histidine kinase/ActR/RegA family two-component response regulator